MNTQANLELMYQHAARGKPKKVKQLLQDGINYREAQLYIEGFHQDKKASKYIFKHAHCKCGNLAVKWIPKVTCATCGFINGLKRIEYKEIDGGSSIGKI